MKFKYKEEVPFADRLKETQQMREINKEHVPIVVEKAGKSSLVDIKTKKFRVHENLSVAQFILVLRKRMKLAPEQAIFLFIDNTIPCTSSKLSEVYSQHKDADGILYIAYDNENTFG